MAFLFIFRSKKSSLFNSPSHMLLLLISKSVPLHCSCPGCCLCDSVGRFFRLRPCSGVQPLVMNGAITLCLACSLPVVHHCVLEEMFYTPIIMISVGAQKYEENQANQANAILILCSYEVQGWPRANNSIINIQCMSRSQEQ